MIKTNKLVGTVAVLFLLLFASCTSQDTTTNDVFAITSAGTFSESQCDIHNPDYEVVMLESKYCGHCQATMPIFLEACEEKGITPVVLDLAEQEDAKQAKEKYQVSVQYTPTFLFGCDYVIGAQPTKEDYLQLLEQYETFREE